jgi:hypothetical protein
MTICGFKWQAPYRHPPWTALGPYTLVTVTCAEPKGHDGPHRSLENVITASRAEARGPANQ